MNTKMRAKVRVGSSVPYRNPETGETINETLRFHGVSKSDGYSADGSDENNTFSKFSPAVDFCIVVANPELFGKFQAGDTFYVDFTPAE
ncbi:hypothetical protein LAC81_07655 [Ensifer adhaerens]|uniref:hypothetical protein n=1 Tax=Ensifer adhaerens TaxID=106592 RepID=UPI001CBF8279|nr:hypothetical protein [Ensifer adhaerens]MBZ7921655.1 hypothetical protein [Ensifer adhaerens]UAX94070.1 hypothetical protein LAC78_07650 [Ensifer adhaerens]UAY01704.1 hypothetical protein LAC80_07655 [Ensifer adhaerens]UAY09088.1 hypothetical protein LAC81_07655 [Ensifer adhaerens]